MKILLVSDGVLESGRGPLRRLIGVLPHLARHAEVHLARLGPADSEIGRLFEEHCASVRSIRFDLDGWFVRNTDEVAREISGLVAEIRPDIVTLCWEIWCLIRRLSLDVPKMGVPFAAFLHSTPFVDAPPTPSRHYYYDLLRRWVREPDWNVRRSILLRFPEIKRVLARTHIVSINGTVDMYLERYFPALRVFHASPGYAVDAAEIDKAQAAQDTFDFAFMAKLERGKGIFELLDILHRISKRRPSTRLLVLGSFGAPADERRFEHMVSDLGLGSRLVLAGWTAGRRKYELLKQARVFLYPSIFSDTFSFCLLEALASGLPAVCYDVPFSRAIYGDTAAVQRVPFLDNEAFARAGLVLLEDGALSADARAFAARYTSWERVAHAELAAYRAIIDLECGNRKFGRERPLATLPGEATSGA
jgi:glycosyltransferase involved in cell wall biosynthesis